jgi:hypothetical protein
MAEVMELDHAHPRIATGALEAPRDLAAVQRTASLGMGKHEILTVGEHASIAPAQKLCVQDIGHRYRPAGG